jgi:Asp-tRNA(Asn)/Glu-tRNA(Gln) amidotransferase B subunit
VSELDSIISEIIENNPEKVERFKAGKNSLWDFLWGRS